MQTIQNTETNSTLPIGVGLLPTHHDKNNERSSEIPPLGHYI